MGVNLNHVKALGSLMANYESDLEYIARFQDLKKSGFSYTESYINKDDSGSFKAFINEFRVARNIKKELFENLLIETIIWVQKENADNVDDFAKFINKKGLSHDKRIPVSLASKILMLNNPWEILPIDSLTKKSLKHKYNNNEYSVFKPALNKYIEEFRPKLEADLRTIEFYLVEVESKFKDRLNDIEKIRFNRYVDKTLWVGGRK